MDKDGKGYHLNQMEHGWTWMDMDQHGWTWINMDGHGWTWMDMDQHGWTWMDMDGHGNSMQFVEAIVGSSEAMRKVMLPPRLQVLRCWASFGAKMGSKDPVPWLTLY